MAQLTVAFGPGTGLSPSELAALWNADEEARSVGTAKESASSRDVFLPDAATLVIIPLLVDLSSAAVFELLRKVMKKAHANPPAQTDLELVEVATGEDRVVIVRLHHTSTDGSD